MVLPGFFQGTEMPSGWWAALWPDPAAVVAQVGIAAGMEAVDLCCGDGWFTVPMVERAAHVTAIDIDPAMLDAGRAHLAQHGTANCHLVEGNADDIDALLARPVDFLFLANAFHGVPKKTRLAGAVGRALGTRGLFAIVNWHARPREETTIAGEPRGPARELRMTPEATRAAVEPAGFRLHDLVELPPYHYGAVFEKA
jgi:ubiquinone/menaquinone biosynthesis C-methylase UbiE